MTRRLLALARYVGGLGPVHGAWGVAECVKPPPEGGCGLSIQQRRVEVGRRLCGKLVRHMNFRGPCPGLSWRGLPGLLRHSRACIVSAHVCVGLSSVSASVANIAAVCLALLRAIFVVWLRALAFGSVIVPMLGNFVDCLVSVGAVAFRIG